MRNLANTAFGLEDRSKKDQMALLKNKAQQLIDKYGPEIKNKLSPELIRVLDLKITD